MKTDRAPATLQAVLEARAAETTGLILPRDPLRDARAERVPYAEIARRARVWAAAIRDGGGAPGAPVGVIFDNGPAFCVAFFGVLFAGAVPVPIAPPLPFDRRDDYLRRTRAILDDVGAHLALIDDVHGPVFDGDALPGCAVLTSSRLEAGGAPLGPCLGAPDETSFVQYTSGSTRDPRGVELTHRSVIANVRGIGLALGAKEHETCLCWLPLFHDLGLSGTLLYAIYWNLDIVLMTPQDFILDPASWLWAMSRFGAVGCAAPNFAYALCNSKARVPDRLLAGLDLRAWRVAMNGAETVQPSTLDAFHARFAKYGFRKEALRPCYGLAEMVVACCIATPGEPRADEVDRSALEADGVAQAGGERTRTIVSVGRPIEAHAVRIVDPGDHPVADRVVGEIQAQGPSVMIGYLGRPDETRRALTPDGWLRTGDLGYLTDGELHVVGRLKDVVKKGGASYDAADWQGVASSVPGARPGGVAVFNVDDETGGAERIVVLAETKLEDAGAIEALGAAIVDVLARMYAVRPDAVRLVPPNELSKTTSGKVKNVECRRRYLSGELQIHGL